MTEDVGKMHESGNAKSAANCVKRPPHREGNVALFIQRWLLVKCKWTSPGGFMLSWRTKKLSIVLRECVSKISHTGWADKREAPLTLQPLGRTELGEADVCYQINILLTGGFGHECYNGNVWLKGCRSAEAVAWLTFVQAQSQTSATKHLVNRCLV